MEASPWKRVVYPLAGGFGKAGWAVAMLVLLPLIGRPVGWLWGLVEPYLPSIPWPDVRLPRIPWPDWNLPSIPWPDIDLPDVTLPAWVEVVMDYQKIWLPILLGLLVGFIAWRRQKKARRARRPENEASGHAEASGQQDSDAAAQEP